MGFSFLHLPSSRRYDCRGKGCRGEPSSAILRRGVLPTNQSSRRDACRPGAATSGFFIRKSGSSCSLVDSSLPFHLPVSLHHRRHRKLLPSLSIAVPSRLRHRKQYRRHLVTLHSRRNSKTSLQGLPQKLCKLPL